MTLRQRIEQYLWIVSNAAFFVALLTGAIMALQYQPSSAPVSGRLYVAQSAVVDAVGDTLLRQGEWVLLDSMPLHRGFLRSVTDSTVQWNAALVSHVQIVTHPYGAVLVAVHQVSASVLLMAVAAMAVLTVAKGYRLRSRSAAWLPLMLVVCSTVWLGTTLPADPRATDAYTIGQTLLTEYIPLVGDLLAPLFASGADVARRFVLHSIWATALIGLLLLSFKSTELKNRLIEILGNSIAIVVLGIVWGMLSPPALIHRVSQPHWSLGVVFEMLHHLPMDATMLVIFLWWGGAFLAGLSTRRSIRSFGAIMVVGWFTLGAIATIARQ